MRRGDVEAVHSLRRGAAEALEAIVRGDRKTCRMAGRRIDEIGLPPGAQVGAIVRGLHRADGSEAGAEARPEVIMAHHDTVVEPNDHVIIFVPQQAHGARGREAVPGQRDLPVLMGTAGRRRPGRAHA